MKTFILNGYEWKIIFVNRRDAMLVDRTGNIRLATTDPTVRTVYLSEDLYGEELITVLIHELAHCTMISFGLLYDIHKMVKPAFWVDAEEWVCNFIADYGLKIFSIAYRVLGENALYVVPKELERLVS